MTWDDNFISQLSSNAHVFTMPLRLSVTYGELEKSEQREAVSAFQKMRAETRASQLALQQWSSPQSGHASCGISGWTRGLAWTLATPNI
ncbi:hypothetical protein [Pelagicoccus sp. SDUM812002]|uniref:hypothetical protein n=1 Tax=Pelagicoccus sp. SDUM812002 TaxID=3041266 RepID=UPI0028100017|nr:hypothetical protein [Pelagicoccus sp. SDUM812002]MDQ8185024.1 hypothetical protein [Pelagicoccus sp. SDUM812002]